METLQAIFSRRSIRKYTEEPVSDDIIEILLRAAMNAASAGNEQTWEFVVISDRALLDEIPSIHPYSQMLKGAAVAVLICSNAEREKFKDYWVQDCAAATENILIAAHSLGLGSCWLGVHPRDERKQAIGKLLKLPENIMPFSIIAIGYSDEEKDPAQRFNPDRIHNNCW